MEGIASVSGISARGPRGLVSALLVVAALGLATQSASAREWEWRNPLPQGAPVRCLAGDDAALVAAADNGVILTSTDGRDWAVHLNAVGASWVCTALVHGDGRWLLAGYDPVQWRHQVLVSDDAGRSWTEAGGPALLRDVVRHEGRFLAVGSPTGASGPEAGARVYESTTGEGGWTEFAPLSETLHSIVGGAGRYVVVGADGTIYVSITKLGWLRAESRTTATLRHVRYRDGLFVAVGDRGAIVTSPDGLVWQPSATPTDSNLRRLSVGPDGFAAVGDDGVMLTSRDGQTWSAAHSESGRRLHDVVAYGGDYLAAGDGGEIYRGEDEAWTPQHTQASGLRVVGLHDLVGAPHGLVAVGADGLLLHSETGAHWQAAAPLTEANLRGVTYGSGQYVVVGASGTVLRSPDGRAWQHHKLEEDADLNAVAWRRGGYVGVGDGGYIARSTDGVDWAVVGEAVTDQDLVGIRADRAGWVALGREGVALFSSDGVAWEPRPLREGYTYTNLIHDGERYLIVGRDESASSAIFTSRDGRLWEEHDVTGYHLSALAPDPAAPNTYVAAAADGHDHPPLWLHIEGLSEVAAKDGVTPVHRLVTTGGALFALGPGGALLQSGVFTAPPEPSEAGETRLTGGGGCAATDRRGWPDPVLLLLVAGALTYLRRRTRRFALRRDT